MSDLVFRFVMVLANHGRAGRIADVAATATRGKLTVSSNDAVRWRMQGPLSLTAGSGRTGQTTIGGLSLTSRDLALGGKDAAFEATGPLSATFDRFVPVKAIPRTENGKIARGEVRRLAAAALGA